MRLSICAGGRNSQKRCVLSIPDDNITPRAVQSLALPQTTSEGVIPFPRSLGGIPAGVTQILNLDFRFAHVHGQFRAFEAPGNCCSGVGRYSSCERCKHVDSFSKLLECVHVDTKNTLTVRLNVGPQLTPHRLVQIRYRAWHISPPYGSATTVPHRIV